MTLAKCWLRAKVPVCWLSMVAPGALSYKSAAPGDQGDNDIRAGQAPPEIHPARRTFENGATPPYGTALMPFYRMIQVDDRNERRADYFLNLANDVEAMRTAQMALRIRPYIVKVIVSLDGAEVGIARRLI